MFFEVKMMNSLDLDYEALGLRVGIEIHQQLKTHKLFCSCPSMLRDDEPDLVIKRKLRPVASELGEFDPAALHEFKRNRVYHYQVYNDTTCLVELDEEPPHQPNQEAIRIAIEIALLLNANIVDEIEFMRKTVIDGSNTSGFQRTALIALNGYIVEDNRKIHIPTISLEEDAARVISQDEKHVIYRLDRLGIPLIEIGTSPDITTPEMAQRVAGTLGLILRMTGKVMRGIGTIRQDLNISIRDGARIELKGAQNLSMVSKYVESEVIRQKSLLEIRDELRRRGLTEANILGDIKDITHLFVGSRCKIIVQAIKKGGIVVALPVYKSKGLIGREIQPERRFGSELSDYARKAGVKGIFHSDELPAYGISQDEVDKIRSYLSLGDDDCFIITAARESIARKALEYVSERIKLAFEGVPDETRVALANGSSRYLRPLPGSARMYPETDVAPYVITDKLLQEIRKNASMTPREKLESYIKMGLSGDLASKILGSQKMELFDRLVSTTKQSPKLIAYILIELMVNLRRDGVAVDKITENDFKNVLEYLGRGKITKDILPDIFTAIAEGVHDINSIIKKLGLKQVSEEELQQQINKLIEEKKDFIKQRGRAALGPLMGVIMKNYRGSVDGKLVSTLIARGIEEIIEKE